MSIFNIQVSDETEGELDALARNRGLTKSEIAREAITSFLSAHNSTARGISALARPYPHELDFGEFGAAVVEANRRVLHSLLDAQISEEWDTLVEPTYKLFRAHIVEKSQLYGEPRISHYNSDFAYLSAPIWFAADDVQERTVPLHQLIYQYVQDEGDEALDYFRAALAKAEQRLAEEKQP